MIQNFKSWKVTSKLFKLYDEQLHDVNKTETIFVKYEYFYTIINEQCTKSYFKE